MKSKRNILNKRALSDALRGGLLLLVMILFSASQSFAQLHKPGSGSAGTSTGNPDSLDSHPGSYYAPKQLVYDSSNAVRGDMRWKSVDIDLTADVTGILPIANMATGTPTGSKFVRDDGTLATPASGSADSATFATRYYVDSTASGKADKDSVLVTTATANHITKVSSDGTTIENGPHIDTLVTRTFTWAVMDTIKTGGETLPGWKVPANITITKISAYTNANTVTFNVEERAATTPNTAGTDVLTSDLIADSDQQESTTFSNAGIAVNTWLVPSVTSASGAIALFSVTVTYTINY